MHIGSKVHLPLMAGFLSLNTSIDKNLSNKMYMEIETGHDVVVSMVPYFLQTFDVLSF